MTIEPGASGGPDQSPEAKTVAADSAIADAEVAKLAADLQDLRQTLLRRQADFDNYRKRIERERAEDSKRYTARMIEALIPIIDGFEHALAAHREPAYENYRKGFELIYKQLLDNLASWVSSASSRSASISIRIFIKRSIARRPTTPRTAPSCRCISPVTYSTAACCAPRWCV